MISSALIDKLMNTIRQGSTTSPATSIAILPLDAGPHVRELGARLGRALEPLVGSVSVITADEARGELGDHPSHLARAVWREHLEASFGAVVYVAEPTFGAWTDECVQQADLVVLAAAARGSRALRPVEHELRRRQGSAAHRMELVLLHEPDTRTPRGTRSWLAERAVDRHHHVRVDRDGDYERVARLLVGPGHRRGLQRRRRPRHRAHRGDPSAGRARHPDRRDRRREHRRDRRRRGRAWGFARRHLGRDPRRGRRPVPRRPHAPDRLVRGGRARHPSHQGRRAGPRRRGHLVELPVRLDEPHSRRARDPRSRTGVGGGALELLRARPVPADAQRRRRRARRRWHPRQPARSARCAPSTPG